MDPSYSLPTEKDVSGYLQYLEPNLHVTKCHCIYNSKKHECKYQQQNFGKSLLAIPRWHWAEDSPVGGDLACHSQPEQKVANCLEDCWLICYGSLHFMTASRQSFELDARLHHALEELCTELPASRNKKPRSQEWGPCTYFWNLAEYLTDSIRLCITLLSKFTILNLLIWLD